MEPFFSIIIPVYNREKTILRAVNSVLSQSFSNFEIVIIDDASTDSTNNIVQEIADERISIITNSENIERCNSRNKGILNSKGKYICFLDSDDYHLPSHLHALHEAIQKNNEEPGFYFTNAVNELEDGERQKRSCPNFEEHNSFEYILRYTINPQRWAVQKEVFLKHLFDPEVTIAEDMDTSLRMLNAGVPFFHVQEVTTVYVQALDSFSHGDPQKSEKELFYFKRIFAKREFKGRLPNLECKRLLSLCYFHISIKNETIGDYWAMYINSIKSFFLYPKGYNGATNKILLVNGLYHIPLIGIVARKFIQKFKK
jgi:glycosyltransferase involved in cell wall biosynthesis